MTAPAPRQPNPVRVIGSIFRLRRDLVKVIKDSVIIGSGLTLESADLLLDLYGARELGWDDPKADREGFVTFGDLKNSLVHSQALLSRRIAELHLADFVEVRKTNESPSRSAQKIDAKSKSARITPKGIRQITPIYEKYQQLCERVLHDFSHEKRVRMLTFNETIMATLRWRS